MQNRTAPSRRNWLSEHGQSLRAIDDGPDQRRRAGAARSPRTGSGSGRKIALRERRVARAAAPAFDRIVVPARPRVRAGVGERRRAGGAPTTAAPALRLVVVEVVARRRIGARVSMMPNRNSTIDGADVDQHLGDGDELGGRAGCTGRPRRRARRTSHRAACTTFSRTDDAGCAAKTIRTAMIPKATF